MANDRVEIEITTKTASGSPTEEMQPNNADKKTSENAVNNSFLSKGATLAVGGMLINKTVNYATSHIGQWTGDSNLQEKINLTKKTLGYGMAIMVNPLMGAAMIAADVTFSAINYNFEQKWKNREIVELRRRSGNYLSNRSREL